MASNTRRKKGSLNTVGPDTALGVFKFTNRVSTSRKLANDAEWVEEMADYYDFYYSRDYHDERVQRFKINYDLYNGRAPDLKDYANDYHSYAYSHHHDNGAVEEIVAGYENIEHHPIIDQVAKAMIGEQRKRPLSPVAKDTSRYAMNQAKRKRLEMLQAYIDQTIMNPIRQQATQEVLQQNNVEDPASLTAEQQDQLQADINRRVQVRTPSEIEEYMLKDYRAPSEIQAQKIIDYLMERFDLKMLTDDGAEHALITGEEVYRTGVRNGMPYVELVNPIGFTYYGSANSKYIEEGEWAKYEQSITFHDFFNRFASQLKPEHYKKLDQIFAGLSTDHYTNYAAGIQSDLVSVVSRSGILENSEIDIRNKEGQGFIKDLYETYGSMSHYDLRYVHLCWRSLRKLWNVKRFDPVTGLIKPYWFDESYVPDKRHGDIEWKEVWAPQVWECDKIGYIDSIYLNKRPVPGQYRSLDNPFDVSLPYCGIEYNKLMRNTKNVSIIDLGKPWQYKFNVQMARLQELEATDIGNVLLTTMQAKPKDWGWQEFFNHIKYSKAVILDLQQEGVGPSDAQFFKSIDLSNKNDIAAKVQYLEFIKQNIATSMYYNPSRLGQISPHMAVTNNQQNIIQSSNQTEDFYTTHNRVVERMLNHLLNITRVAFKENPDFLADVLDDMSLADLQLDGEGAFRSKVGIFLRNQSEDFVNVQKAQELLPFMIQNQMMTYPQAMKAMWAKDGAEILNIAEKAEEDAQRKMAEQRQHEQSMQQQQQEIQKELQQIQFQMQMLMADKNNAAKIEMARLNSMTMANQQDINKNQINDSYERDMLNISHDAVKVKMEMELETLKAEREYEIKQKELELKEKELEIKQMEAETKRMAAKKSSSSK